MSARQIRALHRVTIAEQYQPDMAVHDDWIADLNAANAAPDADIPGCLSAIKTGTVFGLALVALVAVVRYADQIERWLG